MKKGTFKSWKSLMSLVLTLALVVGGSNVFQAQAASAKVYSNNFEKSVGTFKGFGGAKVKLSSKVDLSASNTSEDASIASLAAEVTKGTAKVAYVKQYDVANVNIDLTKYLSKSSKEDISKATAIKVVMSVDKADNFAADKTPSAQAYFMGNQAWSWAVGDSVSVKAGEDFTVSIPTTKIIWGDKDTAVGQCGIQLYNFKEGDVNYTVKSITLEGLKDTSSASVASGTAKIEYVKQYDVANCNVDLTKCLSKSSKADISKATSIKIVMSVDTADNYAADKTASAQTYFMGNQAWSWAVGDTVSVKAGEDFTVSIPTSKIIWGATDTAVGQCGVQLFNFKVGEVKYTVKSVTLEGVDDAQPTPEVEEPSNNNSPYSVGKAKSGKNYLFVTDRWESTSGAQVDLSKNLKAGNSYKVTAYVKSVGADSDSFQLLWGDSAKANGKVVAKVKAKVGKWVKIEGTVAVPKTAKHVFVKFNTKETSIDFGIDSVTVKKVANK